MDGSAEERGRQFPKRNGLGPLADNTQAGTPVGFDYPKSLPIND
jgi:hypothetical protein